MAEFTEVIKAGDTVASLEAVRDQIAADLELCDSMRDKASLYARLADVLARIDDIKPATPKGDTVDEIARRRADRRASTTKGAPRAKNA